MCLSVFVCTPATTPAVSTSQMRSRGDVLMGTHDMTYTSTSTRSTSSHETSTSIRSTSSHDLPARGQANRTDLNPELQTLNPKPGRGQANKTDSPRIETCTRTPSRVSHPKPQLADRKKCHLPSASKRGKSVICPQHQKREKVSSALNIKNGKKCHLPSTPALNLLFAAG